MKQLDLSKVVKKKTLHQWPLSKVEIVSFGGKDYVLKTVHKDLKKEVDRQVLLQRVCKLRIPKVIAAKHTEKTYFLMDYLPHKKRKISSAVASKIISRFHKETSSVRSPLFKKYDINSFSKDFAAAKRHLPEPLRNYDVKDYFGEVFAGKVGIIHGDWGNDQFFKSGGRWCIIDFGGSLRGPLVLDYAKYFLSKKAPSAYRSAGVSERTFIKAKIATSIIILAWYELCKRKYIKYDYRKEIAEQVKLIENCLSSNELSSL